MIYFEKTIESDRILEGSVIKVRVDTVQLPEGRTATREIVEHPGGVGIVAVNDKGNILMVRQFRKPLEMPLFEIPAGKLNYGENHEECGIRELEEETGYVAGRFVYLGHFHPTPGFCNEILHIYFADNLVEGTKNPDEDEYLDVEEISFESALDLILSGEITDGKTIIGILKVNEMKRKGLL